MKFARLFTILLSVLTVLLICQDRALARPADRIVQSSMAGSDTASVLNAQEPLPLTDNLEAEPRKDPEPEPEPEPDPNPFPDPLPPWPPYSS